MVAGLTPDEVEAYVGYVAWAVTDAANFLGQQVSVERLLGGYRDLTAVQQELFVVLARDNVAARRWDVDDWEQALHTVRMLTG